jgi:iron(III) transport system permease protein
MSIANPLRCWLRDRPRWQPFTLIAAALALGMSALILYPLGHVVITTFFTGSKFDAAPFRAVLATDIVGLLANTATAVGLATLIAMAIGSLFAWFAERTDMGLNSIGRILPVLPLLVPPIAGAIGWVLLGAPRSGFLNAWTNNAAEWIGVAKPGTVFNIFSMPGLIFAYVIYLVPHVFLSVSAGLKNLDPSLEEAARTSGAGPFRAAMTVTFPAVLPQVLSGGMLALIVGFALFSLPLVIGGQAGIDILAVRIVQLMVSAFPPRIGEALVLGLIIVATIGVAWWIQRAILRRGTFSTIGGKGQRATPVKLGIFLWPARLMLGTYVLIASVLPVTALVIVSLQPFWSPRIVLARLHFNNYQNLFENAFVRQGLMNSLVLGVVGATVSVILAAVIVYWVDRNKASQLATMIDASTKLPAAVSNLIIGIAFIVAFAGAPFHLHGTMTILFLAYIVLYIPQSTLTANAALVQVGAQLNEASLVSGAGQGRTFFHITLPLMTPGLLAGWTILFVLIAGDITASSMLAGSRNPVAGFVILDLWTNGAFPPLAAFAVVVTLAMTAIVLISFWISHRLFGASRL